MVFENTDRFFEENKEEIKEKAAIAMRGNIEDFLTLAIGDESMREIMRSLNNILDALPKYPSEEKISIIKTLFSAVLLYTCSPNETEDIINSIYDEIINLFYTENKIMNLE